MEINGSNMPSPVDYSRPPTNYASTHNPSDADKVAQAFSQHQKRSTQEGNSPNPDPFSSKDLKEISSLPKGLQELEKMQESTASPRQKRSVERNNSTDPFSSKDLKETPTLPKKLQELEKRTQAGMASTRQEQSVEKGNSREFQVARDIA